MTIEFSKAADLWDDAGCHQSPSALHGWLTGYLATGARLTEANWTQESLDYLELEDEIPEGMNAYLHEFHQQTLDSLLSESMDFQLLLPTDEDADIDEQVECLAQWSKGFLDGFGASGRAGAEKLSQDVQEVLQDLDAFSMVDTSELDESSVTLYMDLLEHARIGALTVFYSLNRSAQQAPKTLH